LPRPVGNTCTVGAIEGSTDVIFANGFDDSYAGELVSAGFIFLPLPRKIHRRFAEDQENPPTLRFMRDISTQRRR
jgi:hypothetical protein